MKFKIVLPPSKYHQYLYVETQGSYNFILGNDEDGSVTTLDLGGSSTIEFENNDIKLKSQFLERIRP